jgi:TRAP-type C4-dicarboxylate transport system substrate-binding protein
MMTFIKATAAITAASITMTAGIAKAQTADLKLAHFLPTGNGIHSDFLEPWARALETCSEGAVSVEIFPGGTQLGNPGRLYDAVQSGAVDMAHGLSGIPNGRFERTRIAELPFLFENGGQATRAIWSIFPDHLEQEFPGVKMLAIHAHNPGGIHTTGTPVRDIDDLAGLRLRFPTAAASATIAALGGAPVGLPPGDVYENAEKGVIDGAVFTWDTMASFNLAEVLNYHLDAQMYVTTFWFGINQDTYDNLPEIAQTCIDNSSGDALVSQFGDWWNAWDEAGYNRVVDEGHEISVLTDQQRAQWNAALAPMIDTYLAELESRGIDDARAIYDELSAFGAADGN